MKIFDLTRPLLPGPAPDPGDPPLTAEIVCTHDACGYQVTRLCLGSHAGTHLDAPRHFFPTGPALDHYPVERFIGPGVVVDCRLCGKSRLTGSRLIGRAYLEEKLLAHPLPYGGFVVLWTEGALLHEEAAQLLVDLGVGLVGTDGLTLDEPPYPVHRLLLQQGILLAENLGGLDQLGPGPATFAFLPLPITDADGAPARAVAWR